MTKVGTHIETRNMPLVEALGILLPGSRVISVKGVDVTIYSTASGKEIFDAEAALRKATGIKYELFMERMADQNKQRIVFAKRRGAK